jgi:hypothetical protein
MTTTASDDIPEPIAKSYGRVLEDAAPGGRLSGHTPASIYALQFQTMSVDLVRSGGDLDASGIFHHVSSQGAVVLMLARRVNELEPLAKELKAIKEMYNLP